MNAQQIISYKVSRTHFVRHAKGEENLLTNLDRVNMRSYEETDSLVINISQTGDIETTIFHLKTTQYPNWIKRAYKTIIDKKGIKIFDESGKLISTVLHDKVALENYNNLKKATKEKGYNYTPAFEKVSDNEVNDMKMKGVDVKVNDKGVVHIRKGSNEVIYDVKNKAIENREFDGKDLKYSLYQRFASDSYGRSIPFLKREINLTRTKEGKRLWFFDEEVISNYNTSESLSRIDQPEEVFISPNPASDNITIKLPVKIALPALLTLVDVTGREIVKLEMNSQLQSISIRDFSSGVYIIKIQDKNGLNQIKRFVKK